MYRKNQMQPTTIERDESYEGETLEEKIKRIMNNKEPITDGAPLIYTERRDGIQAAYDIRTDRWEVAIDAMDKVAGSHLAKREERHKTMEADEEVKQKAIEGMAKENGV